MKALIVDDNPTNLNLFKIILERKGFEVITAANGEDALQKLQGDHVDIIVSDILMPVMDGFHLLQECKSSARLQDIPFAFVTGAFLDAKDEELALKLGVQAFIRKPIEPDNFAKILEEILVRKPAPKKRGRPPRARKNGDAEKLVSVNLMQKLEAKMTALEEEIIEREKIEEALRNSEEQYRLLFETMAQGALYYDAEGAIISANPAAEKILGLSKDRMIGRTVYDPAWRYIREDGTDLPGEMHPAILALKSGKTVRDVVIGAYNPIDNVFHWTNISAEPQFKENEDKPYRVFTTFDDITDRFLSYKAIQESESRITAIMENTHDSIWSMDSANRLITANNAARQLFLIAYGIDLREGEDMFAGLPEERRESWIDFSKRGFRGERFTFDRHYDFEIGPVDLQISVNPIVSPTGQVTGVSFFGRDMTQQNRAEKALAQSEERYRMLINNAAEEIYVVQDGLVKFSKPGISRITGYSGEEIMSKPLSELIHPDDLVMMLEKHAVRMAGGEAPTEYTYRAFDKSGNIRWVGAHVTTITWEGKPATLTFQIDITDRVNLESAVKESEQRYKLVVENAVEAIIVIQDGKVKFANRALPGRLGYTAEEISTMHILDFIHPDDRQMVAEKYASRMRGDTVEDYSYRVLTKEGEVLWVHLKAVIIEWEGKPATLNFISNITAHKLAENALQESEEKYRNILEEMDEVYYEIDLEGNYVFFNDALCRQLGYTREELKELNYKQYIPPEDISHVRKTFIEIYRTGRPVHWLPLINIRRDGSRVYVEDSVYPIKNSRGEVTGFRGVSRDVTEQRKAQEQLKLRALLLDISTDSIAMHDFDGNFKYVNEAAYKTKGYTREELMTMRLDDLVAPEYAAQIEQRKQEIRERGWATFEAAQHRKDGSIMNIEVNTRIIEFEGKELLLSVEHDITERKKAEAALLDSEQRYRSLFEYNPVAVYIQDLKGAFISVNDATAKLTGYTKEEMLGMRPEQFIVVEDFKRTRSLFIKALGGESQNYEVTIINKSGEKRNLSVSNLPVVVNNSIVGVYSVAEDVTERNRALERINSTLEGTIEAIAMMSELRDPYTAGHQKMVTLLAMAIAVEMGLSEDQIRALRVAGLLHDVGKVYVPSEILSKPGKLSELERGLAKTHASASYDIVKAIKFPWPVCRIIIQHHERLDGSGYPKGIKGDEIIPEARILAVADVVEAMTSHRPYRPALGIDKALEEITMHRGVLYDEKVVDACVTLFKERGFKFPE